VIPIGYLTLPEAVSRACEVMAGLGLETNYGLGQDAVHFLLINQDLPVYVTRESEHDLSAHIRRGEGFSSIDTKAKCAPTISMERIQCPNSSQKHTSPHGMA
jgi:hypothetical protein